MNHAPLIIDVAGLALAPVDRERLCNPLVGGVILFARNWESRAQLTALCAEIRALRADVLICVDQEGGRVQRFRSDGFTRLPAMGALAAFWRQDAMRAQTLAGAVGYVLAAELRACGVDLSFVPVLDLAWGRSAVIGDRSLGRSPRAVAQLARCLMHGMLRAGMQHCAKHFPGHGWARADSHVGMPRDHRALATILEQDAAPYRWLGAELAAVMPAHVIYPRVDARPAGFSRRWLRDVLRGTLGFVGAIVSDDLSMAAARTVGGRELDYGDAALAALAAGCDLALLCNQSLAAADVIGGVLRALDAARAAGRWQPGAESAARQQALRPCFAAPSWEALQRAPAYRQALDLLA